MGCVEISKQQLEAFSANHQASFLSPTPRKVITLTNASKKSHSIDLSFNINKLFGQLLLIQQSEDVSMLEILKKELTPRPISMFDSLGNIRTCAKHELKNALKVEVNARSSASPDSFVVDGCGLLWHVEYPKNGTVSRVVANFIRKVRKYLQTSNVFLIFDRYHDFSPKSSTRHGRSSSCSSRNYQITSETPIPPIDALLGNHANKVQLITLLCHELCVHFSQNREPRRLVVTGTEDIPTEITNGEVVSCPQL